jgi:hypothetical protein
MAEVSKEITLLMDRMALFDDLTQSQLEIITADLEVIRLEKGERLFSEGDEAEAFFIIQSGSVRISQERDGSEVIQATLIQGDHFGEEALLQQKPRPVTVTALEPSQILRLSRPKFHELLERYPQVRKRMSVTVESLRLARQKQVDWLGEDETIYFYSRKDRAFLFISLIAPVVMAWIGAGIIYAGTVYGGEAASRAIQYFGMLVVVLALLWGVWKWLDWTNDYYIVTNERVIWLEKVIALYESRQEAPVDTVLTVGINNNLLGRLLGFGDVRIKTFSGQIVMRHVGYPEYMMALIEEFVARTKQRTRKIELTSLEQSIRVRLGLPVDQQWRPKPLPTPHLSPRHDGRGLNPFRFLVDIFKVRIEQDGMVTYRKHWLLLLKRIWLPSLAVLALLALLVGRLAGVLPYFSILTFLLIWFVFALMAAIWWLYEYVDWRNDIYQVTEEHIVDIYRKPLGELDKKTAPLENILSLHHEQTGLIRLILNYGDVVAMVGTARFTFDGVFNPAEVVQDIFLRMNSRKRRVREVEAARERDRVADWLAAYHRQVETLRGPENPNNSGQNSV